GYVYAITGNGNNVYIGGSFSTLGGVARTSLGAVNSVTGVTTSFDPVVQYNGSQGYVYALAFDTASSLLYTGGLFTTVKNTARNNVASLNTSAGLQAWNPNANATVNALAISTSAVYIGGNFTTLNGATVRNRLASVNKTNGTALAFNPYMNSYVNCLKISGNSLYAGGYFTTVNNGASTRNYLASYNVTSGALNTWNPNAGYIVLGITAVADTVFPGGYFQTLNGSPHVYIAGIRGAAGTLFLPFNPAPNNIVRATYSSERNLLAGGSFNVINGKSRGGFAVYKLAGSTFASSIAEQIVSQDMIIKKPETQFMIYPNPAKNETVTLQLTSSISGRYAVVISMVNGKQVFNQSYEGYKDKTIKLNVASLQNGTYIVNVINEKINWTGKLVIGK
ncbi:MAG: T9SS type A sorting domain-containing protein, partial [Panacibacter sp.]